jgi:hypothetical protein
VVELPIEVERAMDEVSTVVSDRSPHDSAPQVFLPHPVAIIHNFVDYDILIIA